MNVVLKAMVERHTEPEYILVENVAGFEVRQYFGSSS